LFKGGAAILPDSQNGDIIVLSWGTDIFIATHHFAIKKENSGNEN
jgi:hypothetical protein